MQVKRFVAADMRRALELVRQALGPDAIILSTNRIAEGVEILTTLASDDELAQLQQQPAAREPAVRPVSTRAPVTNAADSDDIFGAFKSLTSPTPGPASGKTGKQLADEIERARQRMLASQAAEESAKEFLLNKQPVKKASPRPAVKPTVEAAKSGRSMSAAERYSLVDDEPVVSLSNTKSIKAREAQTATQFTTQSATQSVSAPAALADNFQLMELQAELADMRYLLEKQFGRMANPDAPAMSPILATVGRRLERVGLPLGVINKVLARCKPHKDLASAWKDALTNLAQHLPVNDKDMTSRGGVFAFVGPTGVGKTTTIGKLAARYALKHGADKVALVTTDTYRIAAHDQLRSFGRILRVPVKVVDENNSLEQILFSLRHHELVLIDTAGFRHGDPLLKAQLTLLTHQPKVQSYLVLSSNSQQQMLKASIHAYGAVGLKGCVLTKLDETASMGEALGVIAQARLPIAYTTDGQDIPRDIEVARANNLVSRAIALIKQQTAGRIAR